MEQATPSTTPTGPAKPCNICGIECGDRPRTKDPKGGYVCHDCMKRAQLAAMAMKNPPKAGAAPAGAGPDVEDNAFLLNLGTRAQALDGGKLCPKCERVMGHNDTVCLGCGYSAALGRTVRTKVERLTTAGGGNAVRQKKIVVGVLTLLAVGGACAYFLPKYL